MRSNPYPIHGEITASDQSIIVDFPLRGEWAALNTPAHKIKNAFTLSGKGNRDLIPAIGNYLIIKGKNDIYAFFAHARNGSIQVKKGEQVEVGRQLGKVGHSGNSTAPHLHFHLMDRQELFGARGISCCFRNYEKYTDTGWGKVENGIPGFRERIRVI